MRGPREDLDAWFADYRFVRGTLVKQKGGLRGVWCYPITGTASPEFNRRRYEATFLKY